MFLHTLMSWDLSSVNLLSLPNQGFIPSRRLQRHRHIASPNVTKCHCIHTHTFTLYSLYNAIQCMYIYIYIYIFTCHLLVRSSTIIYDYLRWGRGSHRWTGQMAQIRMLKQLARRGAFWETRVNTFDKRWPLYMSWNFQKVNYVKA